MKNQEVLSIDLGSAYSKMAVRRAWDAEATLLQPSELSNEESGFVFPSLVVEVSRDGGPQWLIGKEAAAQVSGPGIRIHRYWKNSLFSGSVAQLPDDLEREAPSSVSEGDGAVVAIRFFLELRASLARDSARSGLAGLPVRVGVPKLGDPQVAEALVRHILEESGWRSVEGQVTVSEPEANVWGLVTRGRNATWVPPRFDFQPWTGRSVSMGRMLDDAGLFRVMRRMKGSYRVLVTDVGAYTTDFGLVEIDASFTREDWLRPTVAQRSVELGIRELDREVYRSLPDNEQQAIQALSTERWDRLKTQLYAGTEVAMRNPQGGILRLGGAEQGEQIRSQILAFGRRVVRARNRFLQDNGHGSVDANVITGGGAMVEGLRRAIVASASGRHDQDLELYDENVARRSLEKIGVRTEAAVEERVQKNRQLVRGAVALGAASVVVD